MKKVIEQLLFEGLWENSLDSMFLIQFKNNDFYVAGINPVLEDVVGRSSAEIEGTKVRDFLPEPGPVIDQYKACLYIRETVYYEEQSDLPNGERHYWHTMVVPLEHAGEVYLFGSSRNIDQQKESERRLQKTRDEAEAANAAKTLFLANMSHELRTPLNGIVGSASLLRQQISEPALSEPLDLIIRSADAMNRLVDDILDLSKIENKRLNILRAPCNLRDTLDDVITLMSTAASDKGLRFTHSIGPEFPKRLMVDEPRIRQILINLLSNAIKFTERGEVAISVNFQPTSESTDTGDMTLVVTDTGVGIPRQKLQQIGTPFYQINPERNRQHDGSGIGLSVCKSLIELMSGKLTVDSYPEKGTTVTVNIPASTSKETAIADDKSPTLPDPFHVLIAEDNTVNQIIMRRMLEHLGAEVHLVGDGNEARKKATENDYNLILMDLHMPGMDGVAASHALRSEGVTTPIVAVTAAVTNREREACERADMNGFIDKPVKIQAVTQLLADLFPPQAQPPAKER